MSELLKVYVEDYEVELDFNKEEIAKIQELSQEIIYDDADCRRALHKILGIRNDYH